MKKIFISSILIALFATSIRADEAPTALIISMTDGSRQSIELSEKPMVTIADEMLNVKGASTELNLELNKVKDFTYGTTTGIAVAQTSESFVRKGENLIFSAESGSIEVVLTSVSGIVMRSVTVADGESLTLSLTDLVPGVYIVTVNGVSSKIVKR